MLDQPATYSGRRESMLGLRQREGIMAEPGARCRPIGQPITELYDGLAVDGESAFVEPYDDEEPS